MAGRRIRPRRQQDIIERRRKTVTLSVFSRQEKSRSPSVLSHVNVAFPVIFQTVSVTGRERATMADTTKVKLT